MAESFRAFSPFTELSSLSSDPLLLTFFTFYAVILLYFPSLFLSFALSPVLTSTALLLLSLLRIGATARNPVSTDMEATHDGPDCPELCPMETRSLDADDQVPCVLVTNSKYGFVSSPYSAADSFVEWDVRAPLEVIHEGFEGQEAAEEDELAVSKERKETQMNDIQRYASLSSFYPESDTDNSSEGDSTAVARCDSPENLCFRWEDEDDRDGLIEIELDEKRMSEFDEDSLIEIDLSAVRESAFPMGQPLFPACDE